MANKVRVEILNASTNTWTEITTDTKRVELQGIGLLQNAGQTSPRGNNIAGRGTATVTLNNNSLVRSNNYTPGPSNLISSRTRIRVRGSGSSLGYCIQVYVTGSQDAAYISQTVTTGTVNTDVWVLQWDARAQFDYQYNTDNVYLNLSAETQTWQAKTYTNKWATYSISFTATTTSTTIEPRFQPATAPGANNGMFEYRKITLKKNGGADVLANGNLSTGALAPWAVTNVATVVNWLLGTAGKSELGSTTRLQAVATSSTMTAAIAPDTWIVFNGVVDTAEPAPFATSGTYEVKLTCFDMVVLYQDQHSNLQAQTNLRSDQVIALLAGQMATGIAVGTSYQTGINSFAYVFDGYTYNQTSIYQGLNDTAVSEGGRFCIDRDGTLRFYNHNQFVNAFGGVTALTLREALDQYMMHSWLQTKMIINDSVVSITPRQISTTLTTLGSFGSTFPVNQLPSQFITIPVGTSSFTFYYKDSTGKSIGGSAVQTPVPGLDYLLYSTLVLYTDGTGDVIPNQSLDGTYNTTQVYVSSFAPSSSSAIVTFTNTASTPYYLYYFQLRGYAVTTNNPIDSTASDATSILKNQKITFSKSLPFVSDVGFAQSLASIYVSRYKNAFLEADYVEFQNKSTVNGVDLLSLELFDAISITDAQSGLSGALHAIVMFDAVLSPNGTDAIEKIKFTLERLDLQTYWILGDATYGVLETTTTLAL